MVREQKRISVDPVLWEAVEAAAKAKGVPVHIYVERALKTAIDPFDALERAAESVRYMTSNAVEVGDQIRLIADYIVDAQRADAG